MSQIISEFVCDEAELARHRDPRNDIVAETAGENDRWGLDHGPFESYERTLECERVGPETWSVTETTKFTLAIPIWGRLFVRAFSRALRQRRDSYGYWWAPPDRLDARAARVLALLATVQVVDGYLGTVLTQTVTFAADEFGRGNTAQGWVLGGVRAGVLIALVTVAVADRRGRRALLIAAGIGSCIFTVLGGLSPGIWVLGGTQLLARGMSTALGILIVIMAAEEMPARSRAWAASVLVLSAGLGSGMAVWVLPVADLDIRGWRAVYLVAGLGALVIRYVGRRLPESRRFTAQRNQPNGPVPPSAETEAARRRRRSRLTLLATSSFLLAMFAAPASGFQNDFLKDVRGFSALRTSVFTLVTSTPAGIGVFIGGRLAESKGRRPIGAAGLVAGTTLAVLAYFSPDFGLWAFTMAGVILGGMAVPALVVYGPELFGTHDRGRANGTIVTIGVMGSAFGLTIAGYLSDRFDGDVAPVLAMLAIGPILVALLVMTLYPETAAVELEDINPEDR